MKITNISPELISAAKQGDALSFEKLLSLFEPLVKKTVNNYGRQLEADDIRQACAIGLFGAVRTYDADGGVTFGLYAKVCIKNAVVSELRRIRVADTLAENDENRDSADTEPSQMIIDREDYDRLLSNITKKLSKYEAAVFGLYIRGCSYKEIGRRIGKSDKSVDNTLCRIRAKLKPYTK